MQEQEGHARVQASLVPEPHNLRGVAGVVVVLSLLLIGALAFVRYLL
jgi:hypothetical protein